MNTVSNRYDVNPNRLQGQKDIISHIIELGDRVSAQEVATRAGHTSIEDGNFIVRNGDIIVSETDDTVVMRIFHGDIPEIQMFPLGENDTHLVSFIGFDFDEDPSFPNQATQLYVARVSDLEPDGGKVLLSRDASIISYQPFGANEMYIRMDELGFLFHGIWTNQFQGSVADALYMGWFTATSGFSTWTHTYFFPFTTIVAPVFTVGVSGTTIQWGIENFSASSFIIRFSTTTGNKFVTFWNFRTT